MERKQRFSIKKLSIGVVSICIGFAFLTQGNSTVAAAENSVEVIISNATGEEETIPTQPTETPNNRESIQNTETTIQEEVTVNNTVERQTEAEKSTRTEQAVPESTTSLNDHLANTEDTTTTSSSTESSVNEVEFPTETTALSSPESSSKIETIDASLKAEQPNTSEGTTALRAATNTSPTTTVSGNDTAIQAIENGSITPSKTIASLNAEEKQTLNNLILTNFETSADKVALLDVVKPKESLSISDLTKYFVPLIKQLKSDPNYKHLTDQERSAEATKLALIEANKNLYEDASIEALAPEAKNTFQQLLAFNNGQLLTEKSGLTVETLKNNLSQLYRGVLYLQQQYSFEKDLPQTLVFTPHTIGNIQADQTSAYDRLMAYGGHITDKRSLALNLNQIQFNNRMIGQYTGTKSTAELVEKIAQSKGKDVNSYFTEQSQALIGTSPNISIFDLLKTHKPEYILPVLSQGRGVYLAGTSNSLTIGLLDAYTDLYPQLKNYSKERGVQQPTSTFFEKILTYQENWLTFLNSAKKDSTTIPFTLAVDTMNVYNETTKAHTWSPNEGTSAHSAVLNFFSPMNLWENYVRSGVGLGGVANGENMIKAYETRFMHSNLSGVALFTHEMTHTNDEARLFGGTYRKEGRRAGQGPEVYARGLFEVIDNTQNGVPGEYKPVFNLNTALTIADSPNRTQALTPQTSTEKLANYTKNLVDLVAYLEAVEARVALKSLAENELATYFNKVVQVPRNTTSNTSTTTTSLPSTNDAFLPYGQLTAASLTKPTSINDLVDQDAVSGQFIPRGISPILTELSHNQYDHVPLLESFYGASEAPSGNNTVGDISFKRHAYEILAWKGWDAFISYISNRYNSDSEAFKAILGNEYSDWASFKKAQYKRLEDKEPVNQLWQTSQLEKELETAIKADLAVLTTYRNSINSLLNSRSTVTQTQLDQAAQKASVARLATNVRKVKLDILNKALQFNNLEASIFEAPKQSDIIYVKNGGNGQGLTEDTPMGSLAEALQKATDGTIIKLVGNATERTPLVINKAVTIESDSSENAIIFNESIQISNNVTLRNLSIHALTESNVPGNIYIDGQVTMDHVSTLISNRQTDKRPSLIIGSSADTTDKRESSLKILNTNETVFDKMTVQNAADIAIANGTQIKNGVEVTTPSPVTITSESNQVNKFQAPETNQVTLIFNGSKASNVELNHIANLILKHPSSISLSSQSITPIQQTLAIENGSRLNLGDLAVHLQSLTGDGMLEFTDKGQLSIQDVSGHATIHFKRNDIDFSASDGKTFVAVASKKDGLSVKLKPLELNLEMDENGNYIYHQPYSASYYFDTEDSRVLPSEIDDLLPEDKESLDQAIPAPETITVEVSDGEGKWVFDKWELDSNSTTKRQFYTGYWRYTTSPQTTVRYEEVPFAVDYQADENKVAGETTVIFSGKLGKVKITEAEGAEPVREVLEKPQNEIVAVGTKPVVVSNILKYKTTTVEDPELPKGHTETVTQGKEGKEIITTTYTLDTKTGNITANTVTETIEPVEKVVKIGTKSSPQTTVRFEEIPFTTIYQADENRTAGEKETISSGKLGKVKITETEGSEPVREVLEKPQNEIVAVGTKPVVVTNILKYKTTTVEDPELPKGHTETVTQGKEGKEIITTTYTLDTKTGNITANTVTETIEPVEKVVKIGTKSSPQTTVRFEDVPFTVIYQADENRTAGEKETISSGKLGKAKITETEGSEPVREVLEKPQNEIVAVGTKPVVVTNVLKYKTTTVEDPELPKGHIETVTQGKEGKETITTTYTLDTVTGNITANTVTETIEPVEHVVKIGTKSSPQSTVRFEEIPFTVIYQADENRTAGEKETISSGKLGKAKITETEGSEPVREVLEKPQNEIVAVGTKPVVVTNVLKYKTTTVEDPELPKGHTETITQGKEGKEIITTTYTLDTATGLITSSTKTERVDPVDEVVSVGTKIIPQTTVRYEEVPFAIVYQADENKVAGETTVIFSGKLGKVKITETEGAEPIREIIEHPQNKIVSVGTMTEVTNTILAFKTVKLDDDQLPKGQTKVVKKGKDGRETTTTTYTLDTATGLITSSTKTERVDPVDEVVSVGILETKVTDTAPEQVIKPELKWTTTIVPIPFQTRYIVDNQLKLGEEIILVPGRNGQRQVITLVNGSVVGRNDEEIISDIVLLDSIEQIIKIGNRSTDKAIDLPSKKEKTDISNLGLTLPNNKVSSTPIKLAETPKSIQYLTDRKYDSTVSPSQLQQTNGVILPKTGEQKENFLARLGYISLLSLEFCWAISTLLKNKRKSK
ncbi:TPA: G5 domain-containing protein [Streptococcus suis]|nr:G5 domain-containing protein [Streptococcus suis]